MGIFRCNSGRTALSRPTAKIPLFLLALTLGQTSGICCSHSDSSVRNRYVAAGVNLLPFLNGSAEAEAEWRFSKRVSLTASGLRARNATYSSNTTDNDNRRTTSGWASGLGIRVYPLRSDRLVVGVQTYRLSFEQEAFLGIYHTPPNVYETDGAVTWGLAASVGSNVPVFRWLDMACSFQVGDVLGRKQYLNFFVPGMGISGRYYFRFHATPRLKFRR